MRKRSPIPFLKLGLFSIAALAGLGCQAEQGDGTSNLSATKNSQSASAGMCPSSEEDAEFFFYLFRYCPSGSGAQDVDLPTPVCLSPNSITLFEVDSEGYLITSAVEGDTGTYTVDNSAGRIAVTQALRWTPNIPGRQRGTGNLVERGALLAAYYPPPSGSGEAQSAAGGAARANAGNLPFVPDSVVQEAQSEQRPGFTADILNSVAPCP